MSRMYNALHFLETMMPPTDEAQLHLPACSTPTILRPVRATSPLRHRRQAPPPAAVSPIPLLRLARPTPSALSSAPPSPPTSRGDARLPSPPSVDGATPPLRLRPALARPLCLRSAGGDDSTTERARRGGVMLLRRAGLGTLLSLPSPPPFSSSEDRISRRCVLSPGRQFPLPIWLLCLGTCLESTVAN